MGKINTKTRGSDHRKDFTARLAGGYGTAAAVQDTEALLRRAVMANLLWEDVFYMDGKAVSDQIATLVPQVAPEVVAQIAYEACNEQKLRHTPLFIAREMARHPNHRKQLGELLPRIIIRADMLADFLALYWKEGKQPLAKQVKVGLAKAYGNFNAYQIAKYNRDNAVKLRDVLFMVHAIPKERGLQTGRKIDGINRKGYKRGQVMRHDDSVFGKLVSGSLETPDTWEVGLSAAKSNDEKRAVWERLLAENKLGALALLRNLRNMENVDVNDKFIVSALKNANAKWLLPINYFAAAKQAPRWEREIENLMLRSLAQVCKLPGLTILVVDVSGSMGGQISAKGDFSRLDIGAMLAVIASELCERVVVYATAGNDMTRKHDTQMIKPRRGFAMADEIRESRQELGGGGIFTRQALEYIHEKERGEVERIIVFSDSQDCDHPQQRVPAPFGKYNYIVDVSAETRGINYKSVWTAEISGWSERFLNYIAANENVVLESEEEEIAIQ